MFNEIMEEYSYRKKTNQSPRRNPVHFGLSEEERKIISKYSSKEASVLFKIGADTYFALVSPHCGLSQRTLERVRSKIYELKSLGKI